MPTANTPTTRPLYSGMNRMARQMFFTPAPGDMNGRSGRSLAGRAVRTAWIRPATSKDVPVLGRAAKREPLQLFALAPVRRGEGRVRGLPRELRRRNGGRTPHPSPLPGGPGRGDRICICASHRFGGVGQQVCCGGRSWRPGLLPRQQRGDRRATRPRWHGWCFASAPEHIDARDERGRGVPAEGGGGGVSASAVVDAGAPDIPGRGGAGWLSRHPLVRCLAITGDSRSASASAWRCSSASTSGSRPGSTWSGGR